MKLHVGNRAGHLDAGACQAAHAGVRVPPDQSQFRLGKIPSNRRKHFRGQEERGFDIRFRPHITCEQQQRRRSGMIRLGQDRPAIDAVGNHQHPLARVGTFATDSILVRHDRHTMCHGPAEPVEDPHLDEPDQLSRPTGSSAYAPEYPQRTRRAVGPDIQHHRHRHMGREIGNHRGLF